MNSKKRPFLIQIEWAKEFDLPIVIHSREATDIIIDMLQEVKDEKLKGIFHCFGGSLEQANKIIDLGFYLGIGGVLTFKKSGLDKVMPNVPLERVVFGNRFTLFDPNAISRKAKRKRIRSIGCRKIGGN